MEITQASIRSIQRDPSGFGLWEIDAEIQVAAHSPAEALQKLEDRLAGRDLDTPTEMEER